LKMLNVVPSSNSQSQETANSIKNRVLAELEAMPQNQADYKTASQELLRQIVRQEIGSRSESIPGESYSSLLRSISDDLFGLGCIERFLRDRDITDILIEDTRALLVYENRRVEADGCFANIDEVRRVVDRITGLTGKRVDASIPFCDCRLDDGSRCHIITPPAADRIYITIRKHKCMDLTIDDWVNAGIMPNEVAEILETAVASRKNILISGGTGAGKTTLLNTLAKLFHDDQVIVTLEDTQELNMSMPHVRRLLTREKSVEGVDKISYSQLLKNALRMNPDRLILGEVRDKAAYDLLHALNIGHRGSISTLHANSAVDALWRLENLAIQGSSNLNLSAIRRQVARVIDLVIQLKGNEYRVGSFEGRQVSELASLNSKLGKSGDYDLEILFLGEAD
jgi:pilus assembly protein CpaF